MEGDRPEGERHRRRSAAPELELLRAHLAAVLCTAGALLSGLAAVVGLVDSAPAITCLVLLTGVLLVDGTRRLIRAGRRVFWRISRKLIVSYVLIAIVPVVLLLFLFGLFCYLTAGQFIASATWRQIAELTREVDATCEQIAVDLEKMTRDAGDLPELRRLGDPGGRIRASLAAIESRFEHASAHGVVLGDEPGEIWVPPGLEWPVGVRAAKPAWLTHETFEAQLVVGREDRLEVRAAVVRVAGPYRIYAEVAVPLDDQTLEVLKRFIGSDLRIIEPLERGTRLEVLARTVPDAEREGWLTGLPIFGFKFVDPVSWEDGRQVSEGRLVLTEQELGALYVELRDLSTESHLMIISVLVLVVVALIVFETVSLTIGVSLARSITGSIHELVAGTRRVERGDLKHRIDVQTDDQLGELGRSFNRMAVSVENLVRESAERERLEEELRIGRRIQQSLLPQRNLKTEGVELAAFSLPAKEVGGDYYDFFPRDDGRVGMLVADVSGKGTEAAFYMAEVKGIMLALARRHGSPRDVLCEANELLGMSLDRRTFVTMAYAVLAADRSRLVFSRAGHNPILHLARGSNVVQSHQPPGLSLGVDRRGGFGDILEERSIDLASGDLVVLYTDGVTETFGHDGALYGQERLEAALIALRDGGAEAICDSLVADLRSFAAEGPLDDDLTMIVMRVS